MFDHSTCRQTVQTMIIRSKHFTLLLLALFFLIGCQGVSATNASATVSANAGNLQPSQQHVQLDKTIANLLAHYHYRQSDLDVEQSSAIFDAYLDALDYNRSFFLASDIEHFNRYRHELHNYLKDGILEPAYSIFNTYQRRMAERTARIKTQLQREIRFDVDETYDLAPESRSWARNRTELDEIWRKRLKHEILQLMLAGQSLDDAKDTLVQRYEGRLRRTNQQHSEDVFQLYMNAVATSFDPHTSYFSPSASENFNIQMSLSLEGIGTVLRMEEEQIRVVELVPGGPAALSGQLHPDDVIIGVGQGQDGEIVDVIGWRLDDVVDLIRGRRGTTVQLKILPSHAGSGGPPQTLSLVRDRIKLEKQAASSEVRSLEHQGRIQRIGIITIPTFYSDFAAAQRGDRDYRSTTRDVRRLVSELKRQDIDGLVIDLRQNGGGSLQEAIELTGLFIHGGPVVQVRNARGQINIEQDDSSELVYDGPLAVLVDRFSASASEIFAGAIQDYGRGLVLGNPTFGKGTVQTLVDLNDLNRFMPRNSDQLGQLKLTIAKFYRISGGSTQHRGVVPDIEFPSAVDSQAVGESAQPYALPWDEIRSLDYRYSSVLDTLLPELYQHHAQRIAEDAAFQTLLADIRATRESREQTEVSLLEQTRRMEHEQSRQERLERRNRWRELQNLPKLKVDETAEADDSERPDPLLTESVRIVADLIHLLGHDARPLITRN